MDWDNSKPLDQAVGDVGEAEKEQIGAAAGQVQV